MKWPDKRTPFDRDPQESPLIKLLLHSESLAEDIARNSPEVQAVLQLRNFEFVDVLFTPTRDPETAAILSAAGVEGAVVTRSEDYWILVEDGRRRGIGPVQSQIDYSEQRVPGSRITWLDYIMARNLDYDWFVVNSRDTFLHSSACRNNDITPSEALNRIRILTTGNGIFYATPRLEVSEWTYYLYRKRVVFPEYQRAWSCGFSAPSRDVFDQLGSLGQRLNYLLRAADQLSYNALQPADNNTEQRILYHFAYLIMLTTGIFDDLAWMLVFLYSLPVKHKLTVVLKISEGKVSSPFMKALVSSNAEMHAYLVSTTTQQRIRMFYPLRDRLQHRQFVTGGLVIGGYRSPRILIGIDAGVYTMLPLNSSAGPRPRVGTAQREDEEWIDPYWFARTTLEAVASLVNGVLSRIDWSPYLATLPPNKLEQVRESLAHGPHDAGRALGWLTEPVYFWAG